MAGTDDGSVVIADAGPLIHLDELEPHRYPGRAAYEILVGALPQPGQGQVVTGLAEQAALHGASGTVAANLAMASLFGMDLEVRKAGL